LAKWLEPPLLNIDFTNEFLFLHTVLHTSFRAVLGKCGLTILALGCDLS
jgi:hypothetical protein